MFIIIYNWIEFDSSSASNRIITARDHASIQINIVDVDPAKGVRTGTYKTYALCGAIRQMVFKNKHSFLLLTRHIFDFFFYFKGESDDSINNLSRRDGLLNWNLTQTFRFNILKE